MHKGQRALIKLLLLELHTLDLLRKFVLYTWHRSVMPPQLLLQFSRLYSLVLAPK